MSYIYYYFLLCWLFNITESKYCQLSGYNLENQLTIVNSTLINEYHLILCIDGKFIYDTKWDEIPWGIPFRFAKKTLVLSRARLYAQRSVPIYLPNIEIGGIFEISQLDQTPSPISPLQSIPITDYWVELRNGGLLIYHIPLLNTPRSIKDNWHINILISEIYGDLKTRKVRNSIETVESKLYSNLINVVLMLKKISIDSFNNFLYNLNKRL